MKIFNSQYHIALSIFARNDRILSELKSQFDKTTDDKKIVVSGVELSYCFAYLILKTINKKFDDFSLKRKESRIYFNTKPSKEILESINNHKKIDFYTFKGSFIQNLMIKNIYDEFMKNAYQYLSLDFWAIVAESESITDFTIDVGNNPYLLNAAACLSYECRRINVKFDIRNIQLPKEINVHVNKLICYQLYLRDLLEYPTESNEIKNLCSLVYILYVNETSLESILEYANLIDYKSFFILILVLSNYLDFTIPDSIINSTTKYIHSNKINDFLFIKYYFSLLKSKSKLNFDPNMLKDFLYVTPKSLYKKVNFSILETNAAFYGIVKKSLMNGMLFVSKETIMNNEDMKRYLKKLICFSDKNIKKKLIFDFEYDLSNIDNFIEVFSYYVDEGEYSKIIDLMEKCNPTKELVYKLKTQSMTNKIKKMFKNIQLINCDYETLAKFEIQSLFNLNEKYNIFFSKELSEIKIKVSRKSILNDSINAINRINMENKKLLVEYITEFGYDAGGLARDWFTTISDAIKNAKIFIPTPNGNSLTFNNEKDKKHIFFFVGQLIGIALTNNQNLNLKLSSFIWKMLLNHKITIDDMKDYDEEIYVSLKWILNNDVTSCSLTFVNTNDDELIENGRNIEVNNDNKTKYIEKIIEDKIINNNKEEIENIQSGFRSIIGKRKIEILYSSSEIKNIINGKEKIDIKDWKNNTSYCDKYEKQFNMFFNTISRWSNEKQQKLLKFVTGSSQVPIDGFIDYKNRGGLFKLHFIDYEKNRLPSSHTCTNHLDIPCYKTCEEFDQQLSYAIECNEFGFR